MALRRLTLALLLLSSLTVADAAAKRRQRPAQAKAKSAADSVTAGLKSEQAPSDAGTPVAVVAGQPVTHAELEGRVQGKRLQMERELAKRLHELRRSELRDLVRERLYEAEAKQRGLTRDQLVTEETKIEPVTEKDLQTFFEENKARLQGDFDEVRPRLTGYLQRERKAEAERQFVLRLRKTHGVQMLLPPLVHDPVTVETAGPSKGPVGAPVTVVMFSEFQCPYCARANDTMAELLALYPEQVRLVHQDFPVAGHDAAGKAAEAAQCALEQREFWPMHDLLLGRQDELGVEALKSHARELNLHGEAFDQCLDSGRMESVVQANRATGVSLGVKSTPTFFVNGRFLSGAKPLPEFRRLVDIELGPGER